MVPGRCVFTLDLRAPNDPQRDAMVADVLANTRRKAPAFSESHGEERNAVLLQERTQHLRRRLPELGDDIFVRERLLQVIERTLVDRLHCRLQRCLRGHQDDRHFGIIGAHRLQHLQSGDAGHANVGEHDVRPDARQLRDRLAPVLHGNRIE